MPTSDIAVAGANVGAVAAPSSAISTADSGPTASIQADERTVDSADTASQVAEDTASGKSDPPEQTGDGIGSPSVARTPGPQLQQTAAPSNGDHWIQPSIELESTLEELPRELGRTLRLSLETGGRSALIHLSPPELGNVRIQLSVAGDRVTAHAAVERDDVRALLEQSRSGLEQHLQRAGLVLDRLVIESTAHAIKPSVSEPWSGNASGQPSSHSGSSGGGRHQTHTPAENRSPVVWSGLGPRPAKPSGSSAFNGTSRRLDLRV